QTFVFHSSVASLTHDEHLAYPDGCTIVAKSLESVMKIPRCVFLLRSALLATCICLIVSASAQNEPVATDIAGRLGFTLNFEEGACHSVAAARPDNKYSCIPTAGEFKGAGSFAEQVKHVACAQFAFFNAIEGKTPPDEREKGGPSKAKTKAELLQYLKES